MTPGISIFFSDDAARLAARHQSLQERLAAAERSGDRHAAADVRASMVIFEVFFCD